MAGSGPDGNTYQLEYPFFVNMTRQERDRQYELRFGDGSAPVISMLPITRHNYVSPGTYNITAVVDNILEKMTAWHVVHIQESIKRVKVLPYRLVFKPILFDIFRLKYLPYSH